MIAPSAFFGIWNPEPSVARWYYMRTALTGLLVAASLAGCQRAAPTDVAQPLPMKDAAMQITATRLRPPIDEAAPAAFETATFALG